MNKKISYISIFSIFLIFVFIIYYFYNISNNNKVFIEDRKNLSSIIKVHSLNKNKINEQILNKPEKVFREGPVIDIIFSYLYICDNGDKSNNFLKQVYNGDKEFQSFISSSKCVYLYLDGILDKSIFSNALLQKTLGNCGIDIKEETKKDSVNKSPSDVLMYYYYNYGLKDKEKVLNYLGKFNSSIPSLNSKTPYYKFLEKQYVKLYIDIINKNNSYDRCIDYLMSDETGINNYYLK